MGARRSNRGIGLELVRQLLSSPSNVVIAACRSPTKAIELQKLSEDAKGRLHLVALEASDKKSIGEAAQEVGGIVGDKGVDYLINNAAIVSAISLPLLDPLRHGVIFITLPKNPGGSDTAFSMDVSLLEQAFVTNVVGPAYITQAFIDIVEKSQKKTIVNVSSTLGSMGADFGTQSTSYSLTKAALNMLVRIIYLSSLSSCIY